MTGFASVILADAQRTHVFLKRHKHGHQQWMLPSHAIPLLHHDYLSDILPSTLRSAGVTLPQEQIEREGPPVAWLYPIQEMQNADPYKKNQPLVISLLTVDFQVLPPTIQDGQFCFWSVHELPENILTATYRVPDFPLAHPHTCHIL